LADPTRRRVVETLAQGGTVTASGLADQLPITRQAVAKHLSALRGADLVTSTRVGRETHYKLRPQPLDEAAKWMQTVSAEWDRRLEALRGSSRSEQAALGSIALMAKATVAEEEYLQIMFWLEEAGLPINGANIARAMQLSPPTVHEMIGRLEGDGYVARADDKSLTFTEKGREEAEAISRRHRLIERFLTDVLGIPWDEVHEEAERLEHAMSPVLEERMLAAIGDAKTCPHGHPIVEGAREEGVLLADVRPGAEVRVLRFENEAEEILHYLKGTGIHPGLEGKIEGSDDVEVVVGSGEGRHAVSKSVAETVSVRADPAPPARPPLPDQLVISSDRYGR